MYQSLENWKQILEKEGFVNFELVTHTANQFYPAHTHETEVTHVVFEGQITLTMFGRPTILDPGKRIDIPQNIVHEMKVGPEGAKVLVAEKVTES